MRKDTFHPICVSRDLAEEKTVAVTRNIDANGHVSTCEWLIAEQKRA